MKSALIRIFADLPIYDLDATRTLNQPCLVHLSCKLREHNDLTYLFPCFSCSSRWMRASRSSHSPALAA
jgi:hypothetical protein